MHSRGSKRERRRRFAMSSPRTVWCSKMTVSLCLVLLLSTYLAVAVSAGKIPQRPPPAALTSTTADDPVIRFDLGKLHAAASSISTAISTRDLLPLPHLHHRTGSYTATPGLGHLVGMPALQRQPPQQMPCKERVARSEAPRGESEKERKDVN